MKKVLLIADSNMSLSGVPVVYMSIIRELKDDFLFDIVIFNDNDMHFEKEFLSFGGRIFKFDLNKPSNFFLKLYWLLFIYPKKVKKFLNKELQIENYDIVHSFQEIFSYPFLKLANKKGVKKRILQICSARSAYSHQKFLVECYKKMAYKQCTNLVFVSKRALQLNNYKNKGVILYNVYDEKKFGMIVNCKNDDLCLTQIGSFSTRKNQIFSLQVLKIIKEKIPLIKLNIVGKEIEDGYLTKMIDFINKNNLNENVEFYNLDFNCKSLFEKTSYVIYPSLMESFGLVLIESQATGIHCFANIDLPNDADMGNVDFLNLDAFLWANQIISYYEKYKNFRKEPINKDKFDSSQFKNTLLNIYL